MAVPLMENDTFDLKLAEECASAFSASTSLGCTVSDTKGALLYECGYGFDSCQFCRRAGLEGVNCTAAHTYGMTEAERFGGRYIYFCPAGFTYFVSPIVGLLGSAAKITVGPFLMVEQDDFITFELKQRLQLEDKALQNALPALQDIPYVPPERVNSLSVLLFMAVGFMNNVSKANQMLQTQDDDAIQGQISEYIRQLKFQQTPAYPIETERALLSSIIGSDKDRARACLNELLGYIFFSYGGDLSRMKSRVCELLVLISRAAVEGGADMEYAFALNADYLQKIQSIHTVDQLCHWLTHVTERLIDGVFRMDDVKHVDIMHKTLGYLRTHYAEKISIEDMARMVYLSPSYFSKVFKQDTGASFNVYLNRYRIEHSKRLLLQNQKAPISDIAYAVGFEDQSYFTKVFKRVTGVSPKDYRASKGRTIK